MRLNQIVAVLAVVACLSSASSAMADGACCVDFGKVKCAVIPAANCTGANETYHEGMGCEVCGFGAAAERCCAPAAFNGIEVQCQLADAKICEYDGDGPGTFCTPSNECPPPVPAVSKWGIASLGLLLLVVAGLTIKFRGALPRRA